MIKFIAMLLMVMSSAILQAKTLVVLGDSISAAYGIDAQQGWVALLEKKFHQQGLKYQFVNESISGDTSAGGLARIDKVLSEYQPDILLLELGANDGLRGLSPKKMRANLAEIIKRSQKANAQVLLLSMRIPPNYGKRYTEMFYQVYPSLAKELNVPYVPFILEEVALIKELMQKDGLHPNAKAQPLIADKIWKHLLPVIKAIKKDKLQNK